MSAFISFPVDIYSKFVDFLNARGVLCLALTATQPYEMICEIGQRKHTSFNLQGKAFIVQFNSENSFPLYLHLLQTRDHHSSLNTVRATIADIAENTDEEDSEDLSSSSSSKDDVRSLCKYANSSNSSPIKKSIVFVDVISQSLTGDDLTSLLKKAPADNEIQTFLETVQIALSHPNQDQITQDGLAIPLTVAIKANHQTLVNDLMNHPNMNEVPFYCLVKPAVAAIEANNTEAFERLMLLPNFTQMEGYAHSQLLTAAIKAQNKEITDTLFQFPQTKTLEQHSLAEPLTAAIETNNQQIIDELLKLPQINDLDCRGLVKSLKAAVRVNNQKAIKTLLILFLPEVKKTSSEELSELFKTALLAKNKLVVGELLLHANIRELDGKQFSKLLAAAISTDNQEVIKKLLALPKFAETGGYYLAEPLIAAIQANNPVVLNMIMDHGRINEIETRFLEALEAAFETKNHQIIKTFLSHPTTLHFLQEETVNEIHQAINENDSRRLGKILSRLNQEANEEDIETDEAQELDVMEVDSTQDDL